MKFKANPVQVEAHKIIWVGEFRADTGTPLKLENGPFPVDVVATPAMTARMEPKVGDYWVVQEDGYVYVNPRAVFERKYSLIDFDPGPEYRVEVDKRGCERCGVGHLYDIIQPNGAALGTSYEVYSEAEDVREMLQVAYDAGRDVGLDASFERAKKELVAFFDFLQPADGPVVEGMEEVEVKFAEKQDEYTTLRTLTSNGPERKVLSRWTMTDEQRTQVLRGADVYLELMTFGTPLQPIRMGIGYKPNAAYILDLMWPYDGFTHGQQPKEKIPPQQRLDNFKQTFKAGMEKKDPEPKKTAWVDHASQCSVCRTGARCSTGKPLWDAALYEEEVPGPHKPPKPPGREVG